MPPYYGHPYSALFALVLICVVACFAALAGKVVPFLREELEPRGPARATPLDGLRGIACFAVMCCHASATYAWMQTGVYAKPPSNFYSLLGDTSVALFFCVTAFLFWGKIVARNGSIEPLPFLRGRVFRLLPLYIFSCLICIAAAGPKLQLFSPAMLKALERMALLGLKRWGTVGSVDLSLINQGVVWSLGYEWAFYAALPVLALLVRWKLTSMIWLFFVVTVVALHGQGPALCFFPGILAVYVSRMPSLAERLRGRPASIVVLCAAAALPMLTNFGYGPKAIVLTSVIFLPIACGNTLFGLLTLSGLRLMGIISFSVYLLHGITLYFAENLLRRTLHLAHHSAEIYWACVCGLAILACAASMLTYRWIEHPFIVLEKSWRTPQAMRTPRPIDSMQMPVEQTPVASLAA
jgi:peptidoglycan/LPS O-acetylase OafA/YrhL